MDVHRALIEPYEVSHEFEVDGGEIWIMKSSLNDQQSSCATAALGTINDLCNSREAKDIFQATMLAERERDRERAEIAALFAKFKDERDQLKDAE